MTYARFGAMVATSTVVMFGLTQPPCTPYDQLCDLIQWYFPHWHIADNRDEDYGPAFEIATDKVTEACSKFIPQ